ncbi:hypothetical protein K491DRAFT_117905 [Lophiostoma macrostomum CBS 122681]|uniref:Uncharacterized protein n=1 Tax=Lophiostoma macrostomum CBS 122681 TaxID=1314788 RepID=A0A6A6SUQ2_9PLEO|nr:hypothetical protein K491DRAFT_117905 [Lophiostoma macrostomum CBS 122681]
MACPSSSPSTSYTNTTLHLADLTSPPPSTQSSTSPPPPNEPSTSIAIMVFTILAILVFAALVWWYFRIMRQRARMRAQLRRDDLELQASKNAGLPGDDVFVLYTPDEDEQGWEKGKDGEGMMAKKGGGEGNLADDRDGVSSRSLIVPIMKDF